MDMEASTTRSLSRILRASTIRIRMAVQSYGQTSPQDDAAIISEIADSAQKIQDIHAELQRREVLPE